MNFIFDLKYAFRLLLKNPGFTALTVTVMAGGLGTSFYMFAFIDRMLLRPLPFLNGERMVVIDQMVDGVMYQGGNLSLHDYRDLKEGAASFSLMGAYYNGTANLSNGDRAVRQSALYTEPKFFEFVAVQPLLGRTVAARDTVPGAPLVAVISHELWQDYFNGVDEILGRTVKVNGEVTEVVGVMPEGFDFPLAKQIWLPTRQDVDQLERGAGSSVAVFALLKADATPEAANLEITTIMQRNERLYPKTNSGVSAYAKTFQEYSLGNGTDMIVGMMLIAVAFVLTLACANVGNLLLARANERGKETAIRAALGAPKGRLIMQMMWESLIIAGVGGVLALLLAGWGLEISNQLLPSFLPGGRAPFWWHAELDAPILRAAAIITLLTAVGTGILLAWKMASGDFNAVLRDGARGAKGKRAGRMSRILVIFEVGLSTALLIIAGVLVVLVDQATHSDYGSRMEGVMTTRISLPATSYPENDQRIRFFEQLVGDLAAIPGVDAAGATSSLPGRSAGYRNFEPEGYEIVDNKYPRTGRVVVSLDFFSALDIRILEGRVFDARDKKDGLRTAIISETLAKRYWPDGQVLGKRLRMLEDGDEAVWMTIVGVIPHIIHGQPYSNVRSRPAIYVPLAQNPRRFMNLFVTTDRDPDALRQPMVDAVTRLDAEIPTYQMTSLYDNMIRNTAGMDFVKDMFFIFALCALLLASTGIYGVMSNSITQRTQEIGVRRALGASDERVMSWLMRQGWFQLVVGLVLGTPLAYGMSLGFVQMLAPQNASHYWIFLLAPLLIIAVVSSATFIPARRAIRLEPSVALHYE